MHWRTNLSWRLALLAVGFLLGGVTPGATFHVSPAGDDLAQGSEDAPFATPARAQAAVRNLRQAGLQEDVVVYLHEGVYYLPDGLTFTAADGGTADHTVTYAAYRDEQPLLVGGMRVDGWRPLPDGAWEAPLPPGRPVKFAFENGVWLEPARHPNTGYVEVTGIVEDARQQAFQYAPDDLAPADWTLDEARIFIWQGLYWSSHWFSQDKAIAAVDADARVLRMDAAGGYEINPGNAYFVYNIPEVLDRAGECYISNQRGLLRYRPRRHPVGAQEVLVSTAPHVLHVRGTADDPVRNLHLRGLTLAVANDDAVRFDNAWDCSVRFCAVRDGGVHGVNVLGASQRLTLYGCDITGHGQHGVSLDGGGFDLTEENFEHTIENNHIHHCGRLVGHGYGVRIAQSARNRIVRNEIDHMPRYAVSIKGLRYQVLKERVAEMTWENHYDYLHSRDNLVAYNDIHHVNLVTQDTGAVESWGPGINNTYDHNLIHDVGNDEFSIQSGIYGDDATDHFTITNNIIYNVRGRLGSQPILVKGIGNVIRNNILIVSPFNCTGIRTFEMADERCDSHVYERNIIYYEPGHYPMQDAGLDYAWRVDAPATGDYAVWFYFASAGWWTGRGGPVYQDILTLTVDNEQLTPIKGFKLNQSWRLYRWARGAQVRLEAGTHELCYHNARGGGFNVATIAVCSDPDWQPEGPEPACPRDGVLRLTRPDLKPYSFRTLYEHNNWSPQRLARADQNLFWKHGEPLLVQCGPETVSLLEWLRKEDAGYDRHSVVADPMFYDAAGRDYRLRPESPAWALGFEPIDVAAIGLGDDFPARFRQAPAGPLPFPQLSTAHYGLKD